MLWSFGNIPARRYIVHTASEFNITQNTSDKVINSNNFKFNITLPTASILASVSKGM